MQPLGVWSTIRMTHSEAASMGPGGGLGWGRNSRVQGCHEHRLERETFISSGRHIPLTSWTSHFMGKAAAGGRSEQDPLRSKQGLRVVSCISCGTPEGRTGTSGQTLEGRIFLREFASPSFTNLYIQQTHINFQLFIE